MEFERSDSSVNGGGIDKSVQPFAPIEAAVLPSADVTTIARFLRERSRYEIQVEARRAEIPDLTTVPWNASIDPELLENFLFLGRLSDVAAGLGGVKDLTDIPSREVYPIKGSKTGYYKQTFSRNLCCYLGSKDGYYHP